MDLGVARRSSSSSAPTWWAAPSGTPKSRSKPSDRASATRSRARRKSSFWRKLSHELRTPLQSISGYVDLLRANDLEPLTAAQDHMLARISESERILVRIIDDVITISRLEAGRVNYNIGPTSAVDAMRATEAVIAPLATDRDIAYRDHAERCSACSSTPTPTELKQILVNLAANAVKFTRAREGHAELPSRRRLCVLTTSPTRGRASRRTGWVRSSIHTCKWARPPLTRTADQASDSRSAVSSQRACRAS